jgi:hypothetical protein
MAEKSLYSNDIERIRNVVKTSASYTVASPALYEIAFTFQGAIRIQGLDTMSKFETQSRLSDSCESVALPGRGHSSQANKIYGPSREMPYEPLYSGDLDLTFRIGKDYLERQFFEQWSRIMLGGTQKESRNNYAYYDDYIADLQIRAIGRDNSLLYEVRAKECYPKNIGAIDYGFEKVDDLTRFSVSLAFRKYEVSYTNTSFSAMTGTPKSSGDETNTSFVSIPITEGQTYYQRNGGYVTSQGSGTMEID